MESHFIRKPDSNPRTPNHDSSRREFLKKLGLFGAGIAVGGSIGTLVSSPKETPRKTCQEKKDGVRGPEEESYTQARIDECRMAVESGKCETFLAYPYLISALYYSDNAIEAIPAEGATPQQEIIREVHKLVTPGLRERFINSLNTHYGTHKDTVHNRDIPAGIPIETLEHASQLDTNHLDAMDLFGTEGQEIGAFAEGVVVVAENGWEKDKPLSTSSARGGNTVIIFDPLKKEFNRYAHFAEVDVVPGEIVRRSQKIGILGHTGTNASEPGHGEHLHFEINRYNIETKSMESLSAYDIRDRLLISRQ